MSTLNFFPENLETNINNINLAAFSLRDIQKNRFEEVLNIPQITIMEIGIVKPLHKDDYFDIMVTFKDENDHFYYCNITCLMFFDNKPFLPLQASKTTVYYPLTIYENDTLIYRNQDLQTHLLEKEKSLQQVEQKLQYFLNGDVEVRFDQKDSIWETWCNLTNEERVYLYARMDKEILKKSLRLFEELGLQFHRPFFTQNQWYGYTTDILFSLQELSEVHFIFYPDKMYKGTPLLDKDELNEWRRPVVRYLKSLQKIKGFHVTGLYRDYIPFYGKDTIKALQTSVEISVDNASSVMQQMKTILKPILTL